MYTEGGAGRYEGATRQGLVFAAANQAAKTYSLFGNTTATGLILSNPPTSGKLISVVSIEFMKAAVAAAQFEDLVISVGAMGGSFAHTTPLTVQPCNVGKAPSIGVGLCDEAATLTAAGLVIAPFAVPSASATANVSVPPVTIWEVSGRFAIQPGSFLQLAGGFTNTVSGVGGIIWREIDI
jgi:hypothetical protein